jgi:eukaryotic-like serine/threonine-protein kinase
MIAVAAVILAALGIGAFKFFVRRSPVLTERDTVVLADFANSTGDPVFDGTLRQGLAIQLTITVLQLDFGPTDSTDSTAYGTGG